MRFITSGGDLLLLVNENRWINDSVLLTVDVTTGGAGLVFALLAGVFAGVVSVAAAAAAAVLVADGLLLFAVVDVVLSFELFTVELLLLLFAGVKLFRGNGFGLIISTKKRT